MPTNQLLKRHLLGRHPSDNGGNGNGNNNSSSNGSAATAAWAIQTQTNGIFTLVKLKHKGLTVRAGNNAPSGQEAAAAAAAVD